MEQVFRLQKLLIAAVDPGALVRETSANDPPAATHRSHQQATGNKQQAAREAVDGGWSRGSEA